MAYDEKLAQEDINEHLPQNNPPYTPLSQEAIF